MSNVAEISPNNQKWLKWRAVSIEYVAVIISVLAALIAVVWGGLAMLVIGWQSGTINAQTERIDSLEYEIARQTEIYTTKYNITQQKVGRTENWLKARGVPIEEIQNDINE